MHLLHATFVLLCIYFGLVCSGLVCVFVLDLFVALNLCAAKNVTEPIYCSSCG